MQLDKLRGKELDQLFTAIMKMDSLEDCYTLFEDLATVNEIQALAQRLEVARQLREGNTYHKIEKATGASTATISRVKRCLNYGSGGYDLALARLGVVEEEVADN